MAVLPALVLVTCTIVTLLLQQRRLGREVTASVHQQGRSEAEKIATNVYLLCQSSESRNQKELTRSLDVARGLLAGLGQPSLAAETAVWQATNQLTQETKALTLPKFNVGSTWLGQVSAPQTRVPIVDEVTRLTGNFCTVFQRINEAGDMLRVGTSVLKVDGTRALGTFIPAKNPDSSNNVVVQAVLRGETYRGRAFVVKEWHATAYEPIWDAGRQRVIGMLYVGIGMSTINAELQTAIQQMVVGKTGYVYVLGGKGDQRGRYLVSHQGKRNGESIWEAKDAGGRLFIQSIVARSQTTKDGSIEFEEYPWQNPGESKARLKFAAITYFAPWDWVIGSGTYEDDFEDVVGSMAAAQTTLLRWVIGVTAVVTLLAAGVAYLFARGIVRPVNRVIENLNAGSDQILAAASQVSNASQSLAEGSSEQAASIEETSASLEEMSGMTNRNAEHATKATDLARAARQMADGGTADMQAMSTAMEEIKASSDDIAKIIKTIDEIAFQTNILALNAAVEAARAGEAGLGFAVVAEEVRGLAQRSAQAARETATKIEGAIGKTAQGVQISRRVANHLTDIVGKVREVDHLIAEVATASREQSQGVGQVNTAVGQMDKITQSNAANAEQSAAAAEELNAQAQSLLATVGELRALVTGAAAAATAPSAVPPTRPVVQKRGLSLPASPARSRRTLTASLAPN